MNQIEYRLKLYQTRSKLQSKGVIHQVKAMIKEGLWERTVLDNNFISGRMMNYEFLKALIKLEHITL